MGTYTNLNLHCVFSTKGRRPWITDAVETRIYDYMGGLVRKEGCILYEIGGMPDHMHLLIRMRPNLEVSDLMRNIKSHSSEWIHDTFPSMRAFAWQSGFGAFSVSYSVTGRVKDYIKNQRQHHENKDFKQEFVGLLKKHGIEYDEKLLWK